MFSIVLFISGGVVIKDDLDRASAISMFIGARNKFKQEGRGHVSLRYKERPILIFSGKSCKTTKI